MAGPFFLVLVTTPQSAPHSSSGATELSGFQMLFPLSPSPHPTPLSVCWRRGYEPVPTPSQPAWPESWQPHRTQGHVSGPCLQRLWGPFPSEGRSIPGDARAVVVCFCPRSLNAKGSPQQPLMADPSLFRIFKDSPYFLLHLKVAIM